MYEGHLVKTPPLAISGGFGLDERDGKHAGLALNGTCVVRDDTIAGHLTKFNGTIHAR